MKYSPIDNNLFIKNRNKLIKLIEKNSLIILNSNDEMPRNGDQDFPFRQNSDLFYLSGIDQEKTILTICPDHPNPKYQEILFVVKTNKEIEIWNGHKYTKDEATQTSGIKTVHWLEQFETILKELMSFAQNVYLNSNENIRFSSDVPYKDLRFAKEIKEKFPVHNYKRVAPLITSLRVIKEKEEIKQLQHACDITKNAFLRLLKFIKPGVKEYEIEAELIHEFTHNRANGHSFSPIIASGKNACVLHYVDNNNVCNDGDLVLLDFGAEYANYPGDCSRTVPVNGKFTERQKELYEATLRVFKKARNMLRPGTTINEYHKKVCKIWEEEHIKLGLYTKEDVKKQDPSDPMYFNYYMHGTSHFIGLDVHDVGSKDQILEPGMVFSCEPGIYIAEEGIGIRLENDILITKGDPIDLMAEIPIEIDEIEQLMSK
ncbi:aminopeptidase P family protein [Bacteroidota bacterium]